MSSYDIYEDDSGLHVGSQNYSNIGLEELMSDHQYRVKIKHYGQGRYVKIMASRAVFRVKNVKKRNSSADGPQDDPESREERKKLRTDNLQRARQRVFDLVQCNQEYMQMFVTITFDDIKVDATNVQEVSKKLYTWLNNRVKRKGLRYILLPEFHKSGRIHMHCLMNDVLDKVDSGTRMVLGFDKPLRLDTINRLGIAPDRVKGIVYNITEWPYGFTTAIYTFGDILQLVNYIQKYMVKGQQQIFGKYFWYSRNMKIYPDIELLESEYSHGRSFQKSAAEARYSSGAGCSFKYENHNTMEID